MPAARMLMLALVSRYMGGPATKSTEVYRVKVATTASARSQYGQTVFKVIGVSR